MIDELGMSPDVIFYDDRLMEASFGDCEGLTEAEVAQEYPEFWKSQGYNNTISLDKDIFSILSLLNPIILST